MVKKITEEEMMEWLKKSCQESGVPIFIADPGAITSVVTILKSAG
jgi:hypothetical protein